MGRHNHVGIGSETFVLVTEIEAVGNYATRGIRYENGQPLDNGIGDEIYCRFRMYPITFHYGPPRGGDLRSLCVARSGDRATTVNYFGIADYYRPIPGIDHWIRRRVRMCYWKQWRRPRTKVRELLRLGTSLSASIPVAMSRKGPPGSHPRYPDRHDQQVAQGSGASVCQRAVGQHPLPGYGPVDSVDRPVRTRMRGGGAP